MVRHHVRLAVVICSLALASAVAGAQAPRGASTLSLAAVAESLAVLRDLDKAVRTNPRDAAAWYRRGMVAWALAVRDKSTPPVKGLDFTRLGRIADTSLRIASQLAPDSALYWVMSSRYVVSSNSGPGRLAAKLVLGGGINAARSRIGPDAHAEVAVDAGRASWRRYDTLKDRRIVTASVDIGRSINEMMYPAARHSSAINEFNDTHLPKTSGGSLNPGISGDFGLKARESLEEVRAVLRRATMPMGGGVNGSEDYANADSMFHEASAVAPANPRAFSALAMLLADSSRWRELEVMARRRLSIAPSGFAPAWMTLGLALQREHHSAGAHAAFDSAMVYFDPAERSRINRLQRILSPDDTISYNGLGIDERNLRARGYWLRANPLWSQSGADVYSEFFARVWYADLRWSVEEEQMRGADTDRGDIYIRYGPPDTVAAVGPKAEFGSRNDVVTFWMYNSGLVFAFTGMRTHLTAQTAPDDAAYVDGIRTMVPARWDNILTVRVDAMASQVARFRAAHDSIEVCIATAPPVDGIKASADVRQPVLGTFWLLANGTTTVYADSTRMDTARVLSWTRRVPPGNYLYRIEASSDGATRAGSAMSVITAADDPHTGFALSGFGVSDVLLATRAEQPGPGARWSATNAVPLAGPVARAAALDVVWENYEFGERDGRAEYAVALTVVRTGSPAVRSAVQLYSPAFERDTVGGRGDHLVLNFERNVPHASAFADLIHVSLGTSAPGRYALTLDIRDKISGRTATTTATFEIRD